jgi:hypothetical protein
MPANATPVQSDASAQAVASRAYEIFGVLESSEDPAAAFGALSSSDQAAFEAYFTPARTEESVTIAPLDAESASALADGKIAASYSSVGEAQEAIALVTGCWSAYTIAREHNNFGVALWETYNEGSWCASGSTVTSATFSRSWATIGVVGWRDEGMIGHGAGVVSNQGRVWSQRKMVLGVGGWDIQTMLPCNRLSGSASGGVTAATVCSTL